MGKALFTTIIASYKLQFIEMVVRSFATLLAM